LLLAEILTSLRQAVRAVRSTANLVCIMLILSVILPAASATDGSGDWLGINVVIFY
jgi:hypothetical protein